MQRGGDEKAEDTAAIRLGAGDTNGVVGARAQHGPRSSRASRGGRDRGYTTVLKLMQIMAAKGLVRRDESRRSHIYHALVDRVATQRRLVAELLDRVFGGSGRDLVLQALSARRASPGELAEIRSLLDELEKEKGGGG